MNVGGKECEIIVDHTAMVGEQNFAFESKCPGTKLDVRQIKKYIALQEQHGHTVIVLRNGEHIRLELTPEYQSYLRGLKRHLKSKPPKKWTEA